MRYAYGGSVDAISDLLRCVHDVRVEDGGSMVPGDDGHEYHYRIAWIDLCRLAEKYGGIPDADTWDVRAAESLLDSIGIGFRRVFVDVDRSGEWQVYWS